jgi:tungstate transport system ATP-binding protein
MPILEARNIKVERGGAILLDIPSFAVEDGEVVSLIGPNGAGKTTLLQTLCYLIRGFEGEIFFRGHKVKDDFPLFEYRRKLAMVFQEPLLFDTTVFKNVASGLRFRGIKGPEIESIVEENLRRFGIEHLADRSARTLSGGEAQRTSLARAFATKPEILLLDEPFSALDPPTRESLIVDLEQVLEKSRTTTIFATHDRTEALRLSRRIAVMTVGQIIQIDTPSQLMNHPASEFVASFVGVETTLDGTVTGEGDGVHVVSVSGQNIEVVGNVKQGERVILCIRPENIVISHNSVRGSTSLRNIFSGTVVKIIPLGPYQKIQLDCGFPLVAYITNDSCRNLALEEGKEVTASFKATAVHIIQRRSSQ